MFNEIDLNSFEVSKELNPLSYNPDDYPAVHEVLAGMLARSHKPPVKIDPKVLSVNGRVVGDKMKRYLSAKSNSSSALKEVLKNPASYFFYVNDRGNFEEKDKDCFELGTFAHMAFLEPELFDKVVVEPQFPRNSIEGLDKLIEFWEKLIVDKHKYKGVALKKIYRAKESAKADGFELTKMPGKKCYLRYLEETSGYVAIKEQHKLVIDILKRNYFMYGNGIIPLLLKGAQSEVSFYGQDAATGLKVKVRPDAFNVEENIGVNAIISFKTTSAPTVGKFLYDSAKFQYELSEGMYQNVVSDITGRKFNVTIMVMLQTVAPFLPAVFIWSPEDLVNGKYKYRYALDTIKDCNDKGLWPGFDALAESGNYGIIEMNQPLWAQKMLAPVDIED